MFVSRPLEAEPKKEALDFFHVYTILQASTHTYIYIERERDMHICLYKYRTYYVYIYNIHMLVHVLCTTPLFARTESEAFSL